jgi:hypothetical protein
MGFFFSSNRVFEQDQSSFVDTQFEMNWFVAVFVMYVCGHLIRRERQERREGAGIPVRNVWR